MATEQELSDFLKSVEKRAFKRSVYHVRNEEAALDIVQDSMLKLAEHYGDKPASELPMLFQRILSNCTLDWFRRQKTRNALFSSMSDFEGPGEDGTDFDLLEAYSGTEDGDKAESAEDLTRRAGMNAIRAQGAKVKSVSAKDFKAALADSRATVTPEMEAEYAKIKGELKKRAAEVNLRPLGFIAPGMVESTREKKH